MKSYLGSYLKSERLKTKLNTAELAGKIGYKNINKGMRKISALEREGFATADLLKKVADTLELDAGYIDSLIRKDREAYEADYEQWLNEPVKMNYTIRAMPTIYLTYELPSEITNEAEAIAYVSAIAKDKKCMTWLSLSRKVNIHIGANGEIISRNEGTQGYMNLPYAGIK